MQAAGVTLTDDEVRDLFSAYHDRELSPERNDVVRAALDANDGLKREYNSFCKMLEQLSAMAAEAEAPVAGMAAAKSAEVVAPDLLVGVQRRLQKRSGGRFYQDGWSRMAGIFPLELLATLVLIALVVAYVAMTMVSARPAPSPAPPRPGTPIAN